ncbi:MAG: hypothetical protein BJ554DRAFT_6234 [Olpidium bornovanus]|uniref:Protein FAR1-RELATED SEQUENCE n=1 Tax=Olpidium bornovanus TaxID=278681 RepID=A0A8H7ZYJ0_9FUNG|nr:MAG: hypothetical protein BJ554DRAFT_6234 [Olpidium bornovanus]
MKIPRISSVGREAENDARDYLNVAEDSHQFSPLFQVVGSVFPGIPGAVPIDLSDPFIGKHYPTVNAAEHSFRGYAFRKGFSIRRNRSWANGQEATLMKRVWVCSCAGHLKGKQPIEGVQQRDRRNSRADCKVVLRASKRPHKLFPDVIEREVIAFKTEHSHPLVPGDGARSLAAYRNISEYCREQLIKYKATGLNVAASVRLLELDTGARAREFPFTEKDVRNYLACFFSGEEEMDASKMVDVPEKAQMDDEDFIYRYKMDEEGRLEHLFWMPGESVRLYRKFGDVVCFDTTCKLNTYDMLFGIMVGVNNHGQSVIFGCCLLRNEKTATFTWVFETWLEIVRKPPVAILTDQDGCIVDVIAKIFPSTKHAFSCSGHSIIPSFLRSTHRLPSMYRSTLMLSVRFQ